MYLLRIFLDYGEITLDSNKMERISAYEFIVFRSVE
jgi:hypothetical protein